MREAAMKRKLLQQASLLVKTNDPTTTLVAVASLLDALGSLMSEWTGESVRVRMTAEGQPDVLDMVKHPSVPDLLEALKDMVNLVELMCPFDGPQQRKARAAIARATGEQP